MFSTLTRFLITPSFNKALVVALMIGVLINGFLCYERKVLQAEAKAHRTEAALIRADNQNLANQLERANLSIKQYEKQVQALHNKILTRLQQAETRSNEILEELENHKNWRDQPVPTGIGRLLNARSGTLSSGQTAPATLPAKPPVPNATLPNQK